MSLQTPSSRSKNDASSTGHRFRVFLRRLFGHPASAFGTSIFLLFILLAVIGPWIVPYQANQQIYEHARQAPSLTHWFGTDHLGRDVLSRIVLGARDVFLISGIGTAAAVVIGTILGLLIKCDLPGRQQGGRRTGLLI